jgi:methylase of polypeptide subunit release factors
LVRAAGQGREALAAQIGDVSTCWQLPSSGIKPGHGLLLLEHIRPRARARVLDLGCGPLALHGAFAAKQGAAEVVAVDINPEFISAARATTRGIPDLNIIQSDLLQGVGDRTFDLALFHPPMLPDPAGQLRSRLDGALRYHCGGTTGRETLDEGLRQTASKLADDATMVIGQFEFLGVERPFGDQPCTTDRLQSVGFETVALHHYRVPLTTTLMAFLPVIERGFPRYAFDVHSGMWFHRFTVIIARKVADVLARESR